MLKWWTKHLLLEEAKDGNGGGGNGGALHGGAGTGAPQGDPNPGASGGNGAGGGGGSTGANGNQGNPPAPIEFPANWKQGLPAELQADSALSVIHDIPSLAKSFIHAQKMIGADKIPVPGKHATDADWRAFYQRIGHPEKLDDFKVELPKDSGFDQPFMDEFRKAAHNLNILPAQAQKLVDWFATESNKAAQNMQAQFAAKDQEGLKALKTEWGAAYDQKLAKANLALAELGGEEAVQFVQAAGLQNNRHLITLLAAAGELLGEDKVRGTTTTTAGAGKFTPAEAKERYDAIMRDMSHPYYDKNHANHLAAKKEVQSLISQAFPS